MFVPVATILTLHLLEIALHDEPDKRPLAYVVFPIVLVTTTLTGLWRGQRGDFETTTPAPDCPNEEFRRDVLGQLGLGDCIAFLIECRLNEKCSIKIKNDNSIPILL